MKPYWQSDQKRTAWIFLLSVLAIEGIILFLGTRMSFAYAAMFDTFDKRAADDAVRAVLVWVGYLTGMIFAAIWQVHVQFKLIIHWRRFLTERYLTGYLRDNLYNQLELGGYKMDNPDQRISMDMLNIAQETLELGLQFLSAFGRLVVFSVILWTVSGSLEFTVFGVNVVIPGYMFWIAIIYAVVGTWLAHRIAHPMTRLNFQKQAVEADFRYQLVRLRENAESIALLGGEAKEHNALDEKFSAIWDNWMVLLKYRRRLVGYNMGLGQLAMLTPYLIAIPALMAGTVALGGFMQLSQAFGVVQGSLTWFASSYEKLAIWKSSVDRVLTFDDALAEASVEQMRSNIARDASEQKDFACEGLTLTLPNGDPLLENSNLTFEPGKNVLISGPSGCGKSTLFRLLSGLWIWGRGEVRTPQGRIMFLPQKPYLPIASLRDVLTYPNKADSAMRLEELHKVMRLCRLEKFIDRLDETADWSRILSGGEQQRVSLARAFLTKPDWLFLDEATAAMDPDTEAKIYRALKAELPDTTIVSIAHRESLRKHHDVEMRLEPQTRSISSVPLVST